jgi:predicted DsbA family dithiol-disulfide isomerase
LETAQLLRKAQTREIEQRVRKSTAEFHAFQVTQRPAFLLENNIGDRAIFSGLVRTAPLVAVIDALLADATAYESYAAHHGNPPPN